MTTIETNPQPTPETQSAQRAPTTEPWPRPDFERQVQRLRGELVAAIVAENGLARKTADAQERAERLGMPLTAFLGRDEAKRLADEQSVAIRTTLEKRKELRQFIENERARFGELKNEAHCRLQAEISEKFERAKAAAGELLALVQSHLGAASEIADQEQRIRVWNREARNLNRAIPAGNTNAIPPVALIDAGTSIRSSIAGMLLGDPVLREFCRDYLARDAEKRSRVEANRQFLEEQAKSGTIQDPAFERRVVV